MSWSYNQIDIYFMTQEMPLAGPNETVGIDERHWNKASDFGIVRSRPSLTPSSLNTQGTTIPGRNGSVYPSNSTRGNAKLQIDILVENSWVHNETRDGTVASRADILMTIMRDCNYISYKMPGVSADFYLKVTRKIDVTMTNVDKDGAVVQGTFEVKPFKYKFSGLTPIVIDPNTQTNIPVAYPNGVCKPLLLFKTMNGSGHINYRGESQVITASQVLQNTYLDTENCLCYTVSGGKAISQNSKFKGDYRKLWIPKRSMEDIDKGKDYWRTMESIWQNIGLIYYYTKEGVDL